MPPYEGIELVGGFAFSCFWGINEMFQQEKRVLQGRFVTSTLLIADNAHRCISLTGLFTYQSGHWETVASGETLAITLTGEEVPMDTYTSVNNYEMPPYIRLDLGCNFKFKTRHPQELNVGIYNVLNRHNPFSIIYDDRSREWRQISLLPIMPNFNWRVAF